MPKIVVCTITRGEIRAETTFDLVNLMMNSNDTMFAVNMGTYLQNNRESTAKQVTDMGAEYLLFVDSDMSFPSDSLARLLSHNKDIVGSNYRQRLLDKWTAGKSTELVEGQRNIEHIGSEGKSGLEAVDALGMGLCLIKTKVFKGMSQPWFPMNWNGQFYEGEDYAFCLNAKEKGFEVFVDHDLSQQVKHVATTMLGVNQETKLSYLDIGIEGWQSQQELNFLYNVARKAEVFVELGAWKGRSTHAICSGSKGKVYSIDHWQGSEGDVTIDLAKKEDVYEVFKKNTARFKNLEVIKKDTKDAVKDFDDRSIDVVFIDTCHEYDEVKREIQDWLPKTKSLICGHDYSLGFPGVVRAVNELLGKPDIIVGTIWCKYLGGQSANI